MDLGWALLDPKDGVFIRERRGRFGRRETHRYRDRQTHREEKAM